MKEAGALEEQQIAPANHARKALAARLALPAAALFWCALAAYLGPLRALHVDSPRQISNVFYIWESFPASSHLYLPFLTPTDFQRGIPYTHFPPTFLLGLYFYIDRIEAWLGVPLIVAQNFVFVPYIALLAGTALALLPQVAPRQGMSELRRLFILWLSCGIFLTNSSVWTSFVPGTVNFHGLAAILFVWLGVLGYQDKLYSKSCFKLLLVLAILAPLYAIVALIVLSLLYEGEIWMSRSERASRKMRSLQQPAKAAFAVLAVALIVAFLPKAVFYVLGDFYREGGSKVGFRSGLDGDAKYFGNMIEAALWPFSKSRKSHALHMPLIALGALVYCRVSPARSALAGRLGRLWLICCSPYFFNLVFFPQAVSIHPYLFDTFFTLGSSFVLALGSLELDRREPLRSHLLLVWFFASSAVIMTNLIDISRAWRILVSSVP